MNFKFLLFSILFCLSLNTLAQTESKNIPISIGYFSQAGYQPGAKIGTYFNLKNWEAEAKKFTKLKSFYVSPQIGFYTWPNISSNFILNADFGYKRVKSHKNKYSAWSIGLGYLNQSQITDWKVNLSDGSKEKVRTNWSWFLPTLNYEFGKEINSKVGWYSKLSYGLKIAPERENKGIIFIELGIKFSVF